MMLSRICLLSVPPTQKYHYFRARSILHAAISLDGGCSWRGHREVLRDPELKLKNFEGSDHGVGALTATPPLLLLDGLRASLCKQTLLGSSVWTPHRCRRLGGLTSVRSDGAQATHRRWSSTTAASSSSRGRWRGTGTRGGWTRCGCWRRSRPRASRMRWRAPPTSAASTSRAAATRHAGATCAAGARSTATPASQRPVRSGTHPTLHAWRRRAATSSP